ncbi:MAG: hypothetical protein ACE5H9_07325, partial [Anaerolineae bacterium]
MSYYYFHLESPTSTPGDAITVYYGPPEAYLDGALYADGQPQEAQLVFRLVYDRRLMAWEFARGLAASIPAAVMVALLLLLPGGALLAWLWPEAELDGFGWWVAASGISVALFPVLVLWLRLADIRLAGWLIGLLIFISALSLGWLGKKRRSGRSLAGGRGFSPFRAGILKKVSPLDVALAVVVLLIFLVRLAIARNITVPFWGDSYQHTVISQLVVDNGGLFSSWEPYADLHSLTYHFGFHANVAFFHWITNIEIIKAVIWMGQVMNILAVLALYPLAVHFAGSRWAGLGAVLLSGLLLPMPMFYVNWGRFTQLSGQVILPLAMLLTWIVVKTDKRNWRLIVLNWIIISGLALTHYRVLIFYSIFVLALGIVMLRQPRQRETFIRLALLALGALIIVLPWFIHVYGGKIAEAFVTQVTTQPARMSGFLRQYNAIGPLSSYMGTGWWLLTLLGVGLGLWQRQKAVAILTLWSALLFLAANPALLRLPGTGTISNFAIFIAVYIPVSLVIGLLFAAIASRLEPWPWAQGSLLALVVVAGLWGARLQSAALQPARHALVTRPDLQAMAWIRSNTPADARFLVNSFFAYGGSAIVGSDGGWWVPLLAERANTAPPLNYASEQGPRPNYREEVNALTAEIQERGVDHPQVIALLRERGVTHIYVGQRHGQVNYNGPQFLEPGQLLTSPYFQPVYHQDRVWVFE